MEFIAFLSSFYGEIYCLFDEFTDFNKSVKLDVMAGAHFAIDC